MDTYQLDWRFLGWASFGISPTCRIFAGRAVTGERIINVAYGTSRVFSDRSGQVATLLKFRRPAVSLYKFVGANYSSTGGSA